MATKEQFSIGRMLIQIALGVMLFVSGIWALQGGGDEGITTIKNIIGNSSLENILCITYGVIELIAGLFLILRLFIGDRFGSFGNILMIIIMIVWIIAIILIDFLGEKSIFNTHNILSWLNQFASHLIILGSIIYLL